MTRILTTKSRLRLSICVLFVLAIVGTAFAFTDDPDAASFETLIDSTDVYLRNAGRYSRAKEARIDSAKARVARDSAKTESILELGREFRRYNVDSAAHYYETLIHDDEADSVLRCEAMLELAAVNPLRGIVRESIDAFESIDKSNLPDYLKCVYFDKGFDLYLTTATLYDDNPNGIKYRRKAMEMSDSLVAALPVGSAHQLYHKGWSAMWRGDIPLALAEFRGALVGSKFGDDLYARVAATLADCYMNYNGDRDKATFYLALSAMSDAYAGTKEATSLQKLAFELYERGDIKRAHRYLSLALDNSIESGSKLRTLNDFKILPVVSKAYSERDSRRMTWLYVLMAVISAVMLATMVLLFVNYRSNQRLNAYRARLARSNASKDTCITQILALCSSYVERMSELNTMIIRKVKTGQSQDLCRMAENGEMIKAQNERFLRSFDKAFLGIYPDFVEELNVLLREDAVFAPIKDEKLTPELRIAAFMRLGVTDSDKIASLLGLSLNTVYTYRNKLRNRASDRENLEDKIREME